MQDRGKRSVEQNIYCTALSRHGKSEQQQTEGVIPRCNGRAPFFHRSSPFISHTSLIIPSCADLCFILYSYHPRCVISRMKRGGVRYTAQWRLVGQGGAAVSVEPTWQSEVKKLRWNHWRRRIITKHFHIFEDASAHFGLLLNEVQFSEFQGWRTCNESLCIYVKKLSEDALIFTDFASSENM